MLLNALLERLNFSLVPFILTTTLVERYVNLSLCRFTKLAVRGFVLFQ